MLVGCIYFIKITDLNICYHYSGKVVIAKHWAGVRHHGAALIFIGVCNNWLFSFSSHLVIVLLRIGFIDSKGLNILVSIVLTDVKCITTHIALKLMRLKHHPHPCQIFIICGGAAGSLPKIHLHIVADRCKYLIVNGAFTELSCFLDRGNHCPGRIIFN